MDLQVVKRVLKGTQDVIKEEYCSKCMCDVCPFSYDELNCASIEIEDTITEIECIIHTLKHIEGEENDEDE